MLNKVIIFKGFVTWDYLFEDSGSINVWEISDGYNSDYSMDLEITSDGGFYSSWYA